MLEGWFFITAALLATSGGAKIRDPQPTRGALVAAGLPSPRGVVGGLALLEVSAALAGLAGYVVGALAVGLLYGGFAAFVAIALIRHLPIQSCGCFGKVDTPPTLAHLIVNLTASAAAFSVTATGGGDLAATLAQQPGLGLPYLLFLALGVYLLVLLLTRMPLLGRRARGQTT